MDQIFSRRLRSCDRARQSFKKSRSDSSARKKEVTYERQDEEPGTQKVRVWGDTAVVTALLWIKAVQGVKPVDYKLWFSDTYVRTPTGWRYVFGQAFSHCLKGNPSKPGECARPRGVIALSRPRNFPFQQNFTFELKKLPRKILKKKTCTCNGDIVNYITI